MRIKELKMACIFLVQATVGWWFCESDKACGEKKKLSVMTTGQTPSKMQKCIE
jgi:hypothetical protein